MYHNFIRTKRFISSEVASNKTRIRYMNTENHSLLLITVALTQFSFLSQAAPTNLVYTAEHHVAGSEKIG
jgi:hypothetical protein